MSSFVLTKSRVHTLNVLATVMPFVSMVFCLGILVAAGFIYSVTGAREKVNRISFRLMLWTMVLEVGYNICYILCDPNIWNATENTVGCACVVYMQLVCESGTNYLCTAIAINLTLYISFQVDTVARRFERWYIGICLFLALVIPLPSAIIGHYGYDPVYGPGVCYFTGDDPYKRELQFVLDIYLWQGLTTLVATIAIGIVIVTLIRQGRETSRVFFSSSLTTSEDRIELGSQTISDLDLHFLRQKLRGILIRVSMYPIFLIFVGVTLMVSDLYLSYIKIPQTWPQYILLVNRIWLLGGRSLPFAILGIFVDPSLVRGVRAAWSIKRGRVQGQSSSLTPMLDEGRIAGPGKTEGESGVEMDFLTALAGIEPLSNTQYIYNGPLHVTIGNNKMKLSKVNIGNALQESEIRESLNDKNAGNVPDLSEIMDSLPPILADISKSQSTSDEVDRLGQNYSSRLSMESRKGLVIRTGLINRPSQTQNIDLLSSRQQVGATPITRPLNPRQSSLRGGPDSISSPCQVSDRQAGEPRVGEDIRKVLEEAVQRM